MVSQKPCRVRFSADNSGGLACANHDAAHLRHEGLMSLPGPASWRRPWGRAESSSHSTSISETFLQSPAARSQALASFDCETKARARTKGSAYVACRSDLVGAADDPAKGLDRPLRTIGRFSSTCRLEEPKARLLGPLMLWRPSLSGLAPTR
jgi:hypothetical protein